MKGRSQGYADTIITIQNDTIICDITLVNDVNIFYAFKNKKTSKSTHLPLSTVTYFSHEWSLNTEENKVISGSGFNNKFNADNTWKFGVNIRYQYNYPIVQQSLLLSTFYNGHHIYAGPEYTRLLLQSLDKSDDYQWEQQYLGVNFGYRYYLDSWNTTTNFYVGTSFSIFEGEYYEYQHGPPYLTVKNPTVVINTATIGINQRLGKFLMISLGGGMGSTAGFFLLIEDFIYHSELVVQARF